MEQLIVEIAVLEYLIKVIPVGIGNEYLTKVDTRDQTYDVLYTLCVEFIENVIEKE
jgi:hypothetical protein